MTRIKQVTDLFLFVYRIRNGGMLLLSFFSSQYFRFVKLTKNMVDYNHTHGHHINLHITPSSVYLFRYTYDGVICTETQQKTRPPLPRSALRVNMAILYTDVLPADNCRYYTAVTPNLRNVFWPSTRPFLLDPQRSCELRTTLNF